MKQKERIYSVQKILELFKDNKINFYLEYSTGDRIERKDDWNVGTKSNFIHSLLNENIISPIYIYKSSEDKYFVIDGKERLKSIIDYVNNEFAIDGYLFDLDKNALTDKAFYSLKTKLQNKILNYKLTIIEQTGTLEEAIETFTKCNGGVPVKPIELFRAKMGSQLTTLKNICSHKFFGLIELGSKNTFNNYELALYLYMLESNPGIGLAKKEKEEFILNINGLDKYKKTLEYNIKKKLDYLFLCFNNKTYLGLEKGDRYLKKSHILILYRLTLTAIKNKVKTEDFFKWANKFYSTEKEPKNIYWIESSRGSTTAKSSMDVRFLALKVNFDSCFADVLTLEVVEENIEVDKNSSEEATIQLSVKTLDSKKDDDEDDDIFSGYVM